MNRDFFDDLTDPRTANPIPRDEPSRDLYAHLRPAIDLLHKAAPENGIDLVPHWERFLAEQAQCDGEAECDVRPTVSFSFMKAAQRYSWLTPVLRYAAVLLLGLGLGSVAGGTKNFNLAPTSDLDTLNAVCEYTPSQREAMFAFLRQADSGPADSLRLASADLAVCMGCHDAALGQRLKSAFGP